MFANIIFITAMAIATVARSSSVPLTNLALEKPAFQTDTSHDGVPSLAVDGNIDSNFKNGSCTHTYSYVGPWWAVDLGQIYAIDHVTVYGRTDCCADRLSDVKLLIGATNENYVQRGFLPGTLTPSHTFNMTSPVNGRWVKIVRSSDVNDAFTVCEVQVFGYPTDECANIKCDQCPPGYIHAEDETCCGQCQCPKKCPELPCKNKLQFQEDGMCCPGCMCSHNGKYVKSGPVGDVCDGCECVNGEITCNPVQCIYTTKLQCVDMVKGKDCCYTCPNGETCRHKNKVIVKGQIEQIKKEMCMCAPFWHPNAFCLKTNVKSSIFKGIEKDVVAEWIIPFEDD